MDDDVAGEFAATSASGDLGEELEGAFAGAEIRSVEGGVGGEDADKGDVGEVVSLGNHLGSDEDVGAAGTKEGEEFVVATEARGDVGVHAEDVGMREATLGDGLNALGADTGVFKDGRGARGALFGQGEPFAATVATQALVGLVKGVVHGTMGAGGGEAAGRTKEGGGVSAPVEEEDDLLASVKRGGHGFEQWF